MNIDKGHMINITYLNLSIKMYDRIFSKTSQINFTLENATAVVPPLIILFLTGDHLISPICKSI